MGETLQKKERDYWFDNAKAFLILCVVLGHLAEDLIANTDFPDGDPKWLDTLFRSIYVFHMPVFVIISGRFARSRIDRNDWIGVINKLVVPYIVVQTAMMVFYAVTGYAAVSSFSYLSPLFGIWYLFTIAVYQLITPHLKKIRGLFFIALMVAIGIQFGEKAPTGGFMRLFTFYPFFLFGYYTSGFEFQVCRKNWFRLLSAVAFCVLFAVVWKYSHYFSINVLTLKKVYSAVTKYFYDLTRLEYLLFSLLHYAAGFAFFFFLLGISPGKKTVFTHLGTHSVYVYLLHLFIVVFVRSVGLDHGFLDLFNSDLKAAVYLLAAFPVAFILASGPVRKATAWLVAPKFDLKKLVSRITEE